MLSCDGGFLPTDECKYSIFFTINALLEYYFFNYKELSRNRRNSHYLNFGYIPYQIAYFE